MVLFTLELLPKLRSKSSWVDINKQFSIGLVIISDHFGSMEIKFKRRWLTWGCWKKVNYWCKWIWKQWHLKALPFCCSTKGIRTCLSIYCMRLRRKVIWMGEIWIIKAKSITFISDINVVTSSKYWTLAGIALNCTWGLCECHFLFEVYLQQERFPKIIRRILTLTICNLVPFERGVASDGSAEFCADEGESVLNVVAFLVELFCTKSVFRC